MMSVHGPFTAFKDNIPVVVAAAYNISENTQNNITCWHTQPALVSLCTCKHVYT